ncbi:MAG TPA: histidine phosphatase family protein [Acetobacteraceae bacterium]|jgi:broad specificity phosphatase PhoE|nr:histidine phosphatase family protein [Acetobacteraceae bacterium]
MPPGLIWLVRHGQSASNAGLPAVGHGEVPLTALGQEQAREVARRVDRQPDRLIVSPFVRAQETAAPIRERWPRTPCEVWPIQELTYLSPSRCKGTTADVRRPWIETYWRGCDPDYVDGPDAESFRAFMARLADFDSRLSALGGDFAIAIGHGQFFRAYLWGRDRGFAVAPEWMREYRAAETSRPMANCEIIELKAADH